MKENVEEALEMLQSVVQEHFTQGEMPIQFASARTLLATELIADALGFEANQKLVKLYQENRDCELVLLPDNNSVDLHLGNLKELKERLGHSVKGRNTLMFIGHEDPMIH
jgi:hypothetical protein